MGPLPFSVARSNSLHALHGKLDRSLLQEKHTTRNVVTQKWEGVLPTHFKLKQANMWNKEKVRKEAGLLSLTWHRAVAVNEWRGRIDNNVDQCCPVCLTGTRKYALHRFWECSSAGKAWKRGVYILQLMESTGREGRQRRMINKNTTNGEQREGSGERNCGMGNEIDQLSNPTQFHPSWKHCLFAYRILRRFKTKSRFWLLLRGVIIWTIWIERNDAAFNGVHWAEEKLYQTIWLHVIDYGRNDWFKTQHRMRNTPPRAGEWAQKFHQQWCKKNILASWQHSKPDWKLVGPSCNFVSSSRS